VAATRLLILADPKMIPALAGGLRDGGTFDVTAVSLAEPGLAQAAADRAEALAVFYGAPGAPLSAALQALAPKLRERGGRVVAVLQREQAAQRDECFRAGASDLLFMPMPKDQFVARLAGSVGLAFAREGGAPAAVAVAARGSSSRLDRATISPAGVEAPSQLPLKAGDTVRVSWGAFQSWGLVVRGGPSAQIRFAGLAPEEEAKIREWIASAGPQAAAANAAQPAPSLQQRAPVADAAPQPPAGRSAPGAGPPPGFADRRPARPQTRPAPRPAAPSPAPSTGAAAVERRADMALPVAPPAIVAPQPRGQNGAGGLSALFEGDGASPAAAAPAAQRPAAPEGPPWPAPVSFPICKAAAIQLLTDETVGRDVPKNVAASARKITGMLSVGERASIQRSGQDSHFVDALAARIVLDAAAAEGTRLASAGAAPVVDADSLAALTKIADEAAGRLQKEANSAIGKGEVESLQLVTAASASLSRDLLNLKETADRLRGVGAAPRLGGHLDPDMVLPGQQPRPRPPPGPVAPVPVKAELRDFQGLDHKPARSKGLIAMIVVAGAIAAAANAFYFGVPHQEQVAVEGAGDGVQRIAVSGTSAVVTVTPEWLAAPDANLARLLRVLRAQKVTKALLTLPNGSSAGIVDVAAGKVSGLPASPQK
jgi:DNA-binding NarL/FixJ family response regulator